MWHLFHKIPGPLPYAKLDTRDVFVTPSRIAFHSVNSFISVTPLLM
jgi:hypothetical protein